jgi:hypothetical protein
MLVHDANFIRLLIGPGLGAFYVATLHLRMATRVVPGIKSTNANGVSKKRALARSRRGAVLCFTLVLFHLPPVYHLSFMGTVRCIQAVLL